MAFHHTKIVQRDRPKPHLRLHCARQKDRYTGAPMRREPLLWRVDRINPPDFAANIPPMAKGILRDVCTPIERTAWWATSRLALDAAFYQFACEWPAGRG